MKIYGYCRISDASQNESRQVDAMAGLNIPQAQVYLDKQSGKDFDRPAWQAMVKKLRAGDLLYVGSIDRLGRGGYVPLFYRYVPFLPSLCAT